MEHETGAFFSELNDESVEGIVVVEVNDDSEQYRLAEKWDPSDDSALTVEGARWSAYWVSEDALLDRLNAGDMEFKQQLSDKQLRGVRNLAGVSEKVAA